MSLSDLQSAHSTQPSDLYKLVSVLPRNTRSLSAVTVSRPSPSYCFYGLKLHSSVCFICLLLFLLFVISRGRLSWFSVSFLIARHILAYHIISYISRYDTVLSRLLLTFLILISLKLSSAEV